MREELDEAEMWLNKAITFARKHKHAWYTMQPMRSLARCYLAQGKVEKAIQKARETIDFAHENRNKTYADMARLVLAEALLEQGDPEECENALAAMEGSDQSDDFFVLGNIQRIKGLAALAQDDLELAIHHFSRGLTIFEAAEDLYHTAIMHYLLGANLDPRSIVRAKRHLTSALDIFKKLGIKSQIAKTATELERVEAASTTADNRPAGKRSNSLVSQLLTVRLAEATASRELLFRELVAVLQQDSNATKIVITQFNDQKRLYPFITHGCSPQESNELITKFNDARLKGDEKTFARTKNVAVFLLRGSAAAPAYLIMSPQSGAV